MLIAPFSSTQTGHGTETIASGDTINACRAVGIAKTSNTASSATLGIRHRVGGVDTTSAPHTLTTTDAVYRGTVFTTSTTNLDSAEIGAVRNAGSRTLTVEDMWLMVDYTAAGGEPEPPPLRSLALLGVGQ
jgi:hypothetical protein